jgi:hypothetical protein
MIKTVVTGAAVRRQTKPHKHQRNPYLTNYTVLLCNTQSFFPALVGQLSLIFEMRRHIIANVRHMQDFDKQSAGVPVMHRLLHVQEWGRKDLRAADQTVCPLLPPTIALFYLLWRDGMTPHMSSPSSVSVPVLSKQNTLMAPHMFIEFELMQKMRRSRSLL